ncbi:MAG: hypothetical protein RR891_08080 [Clostridium sp.]|uniref:hypothetical protein n=1 Tax=Clostridium sp. TaxID=1506 RepID=UPI00304A250C
MGALEYSSTLDKDKHKELKQIFEETSSRVVYAFDNEAIEAKIESEILYGIRKVSKVGGDAATLEFIIESEISGDQFVFNVNSVKVDNVWKIDIESFMTSLVNFIKSL